MSTLPPEGWEPPYFYDISIDGYRLVTQCDVNKWQAVVLAYGRLRSAFKDEHESLIKRMNADSEPQASLNG